jgi:hypothetical protein
MKTKVLYSAIAVAVGLLGSALGFAAESAKAASPCNAGTCPVNVTITNCTAVGGVSVLPDPLPVDQTNKIEWKFATPGYKFPKNGIIIGDDPAGELDKPVVAPNGKKVTVHDKYKKTDYKIYYAVNVMKDDGTPCVPLDPIIYNQ